MRFTAYPVASSFVAILMVMSLWSVPSQSLAAPQSPLKLSDQRVLSSEDVERILSRTLSFVCDEQEFREVRKGLEAETKINIVIDPNLEGEFDDETLITCNMNNVRMVTGLRFLLKPYNATYKIDDGVLVIISIDDTGLEENLRTRVFDCRQLRAKFSETQPMALNNDVADGKKKGSQLVQPPGQDKENVVTSRTREYLLVNLIQNNVAPDSWADTGSGEGSLTFVNGLLVVTQSQLVLEKIEKLLDDLKTKSK